MGIRSGKGDKGFTDLFFLKRTSKDSVHIKALGDLDELSCYIGLVKSKTKVRKVKSILEQIQITLSKIETEIIIDADKKKKLGLLLNKEDVDWIESVVYEFEGKVKPQKYFYIPGENEVSAFFDIARAVARRAERNVVSLFRKSKDKNENVLSYLNCVSDLLFLLARQEEPKKKKTKRRAVVKRGKNGQ